MVFLYILLAVILVSAVSLVGVLFISKNEREQKWITPLLVSFAVGSMLGGAFVHMIPEAVEGEPGLTPFLLIIAGVLLFFIIEKYFHWRHCHERDCEVHSVAYLNLVGDGIHNFMDGIAIAAAFLIDIKTGIATTIAMTAHEIPQEIGDFGILVHSGLSKTKALMYNLLSALGAVAGAVLTYLFASSIQGVTAFLIPIAAGGFIYMAGTDLMPELHKEKRAGGSLIQLLLMILGVAFMWVLKVYFEVG